MPRFSRRAFNRGATLPLVMILALVLGACSGAKKAEQPPETLPDATKSTAPECQIAQDGSSSITAACQDILFVTAVRDNDFPALDDLDDKKLVGFARGLCAYAATMADKDPSEMPVFGDLLASTSNSWGVSVEAVESVYNATKMLCPDEYAVMTKMPRSDRGLQVELHATGEGTATVSYMLPHGLRQEEHEVALPWSQTLFIPEAIPLSISVTPLGDSKVGCRMAVGSNVLDEERVAAEKATCEASADDVDKALVQASLPDAKSGGRGVGDRGNDGKDSKGGTGD